MYRLTILNSVKEFLPTSLPSPITRRIYRWGMFWGILQNGEWIVETRKHISVDSYILEEVTHFPHIHAPPAFVDDVWDEEIISINDIEYNGTSISVVLPGSILKKWCSKHGLSIPDICVSEKIEESELSQHPKETSAPRFNKPIFNSNRENNYKNGNKNYGQNNSSFQKNKQVPFQRKCLIMDD